MKQGSFETRPYIFASFALLRLRSGQAFAIRFFLLRTPFGFAQGMLRALRG